MLWEAAAASDVGVAPDPLLGILDAVIFHELAALYWRHGVVGALGVP